MKKWFYHHGFLGNQRVSAICSRQETCSPGPWTPLCGGGWEGSHIPPPPTRQHLPLRGVPAAVWVSANKDLWAVPDSGFIALELLPVYRSAGKTHSRSAGIKWGPQGRCVSHGLMTQTG